jgi:hypothetical protein
MNFGWIFSFSWNIQPSRVLLLLLLLLLFSCHTRYQIIGVWKIMDPLGLNFHI